MRKILLSLMIMALLVVFVGPVMAEVALKDYRYISVNATRDKTGHLIPVTLIIPGKCRILQLEVSPCLAGNSTSTESWACIMDASAQGYAIDKAIEGEIESDDADTAIKEYKRPLPIANGVYLEQGAFTTVTIEWERLLP